MPKIKPNRPSPPPLRRASKRNQGAAGDPFAHQLALDAALLCACHASDRRAALEAVLAGADVCAKDDFQRSGLHWSALNPVVMLPVIHALTLRGAHTWGKDIFGLTPIDLLLLDRPDPALDLERQIDAALLGFPPPDAPGADD